MKFIILGAFPFIFTGVCILILSRRSDGGNTPAAIEDQIEWLESVVAKRSPHHPDYTWKENPNVRNQ